MRTGRGCWTGWCRAFTDRPRVALVHGEPAAMDALARCLAGLGASVQTPGFSGRLDLRTWQTHGPG